MTSARLPESIRPIGIKMLREYAEPFSEDFYGGSRDWGAAFHIQSCPVTIPDDAEVEEVTATEFAGTSNDPEEVVYLVAYDDHSKRGITCACGKFTHLRMAQQGTMCEFLMEILSDPDYQVTIERRE